MDTIAQEKQQTQPQPQAVEPIPVETAQTQPDPQTTLTKMKKSWKLLAGIGAVCLLLIIILSITVNGKSPQNKTTTQPSNTPSNNPAKDNTPKINPFPQTIDKLLIYAKQTQTLHVDQKDWPILTIFSYDVNTQQQTPLFSIGGVRSTPENFYFIKEKNQILINQQHLLKLYDGKTGTIETIYNGNQQTDFITGSAVSNDNQKVAFNVTNGMSTTGPEKDNLYIADLNTRQTNLILSQNRATQNGIYSGWLSPYFWTPDNKAIIMNYVDNQDNILGMAEIAINGSNLHNLTDLIDSGQVSNDRNYYAYTQQAVNPAPWACQDQGMTAIQLYNTQLNTNTTIAGDPISLFRIISWSPDNQQILYQQQKYQSGNGCAALFYDTQTFTYNLTTQQTQQLTSPDDTLKAWSNFLSINTDTEQNQTNLTVNGQTIDSVPTKEQIFSIGTVN
jgi:flagellar basal body-associated protein FliL